MINKIEEYDDILDYLETQYFFFPLHLKSNLEPSTVNII